MTASRFVNPRSQFFDDSGAVLGGGKMYFYENNTLTDKTTYADVNESTANAQPVLLTAAGRLPNVFFEGTARMILTDADDNQIFDVNDVEAVGGFVSFDVWTGSIEYGQGDIVKGSDGNYYRSLSASNTGNDPTSSPTVWEQITFVGVWNTNITYGAGIVVKDSSGLLWTSLVGSNTGNTPASSPAYWTPATYRTPAWYLLDEVSPTSVTSFQVTGIPADAVQVLITWSDIGVSSNNGSNKNFVRVMDDSTVQTSGYQCDATYYQNSGTTGTLQVSNKLQMNYLGAGSAAQNQWGFATLTKNATTGTWQYVSHGYATASDFEPLYAMGHTPVISGTMNGLEFSNDDGNTYDDGTLSVYYSLE